METSQETAVVPKIEVSPLRRSAQIGKLIEALAKAGTEFGEITKDTENPYFKSSYADLATLIKHTRPALAKYGLVILQLPRTDGSKAIVTTLLAHSSDQWIENELGLTATKADAQGMGSAITYARRYGYQAILNVAGEEDDDGNAAVGKTQQDRKSISTESGPGMINPVQQRALVSACKTGGRTDRQLIDYLGTLGYESPEELPKEQFNTVLKWALNKQDDVQQALEASVSAARKRNGKQTAFEPSEFEV
jgi:hypothetical protein